MFFSDVIGQQPTKIQLLQSFAQNRVSHAQLFLGPEGTGNLAMALAFAQYLNCENKTENDSCGTCPSCIKAQKFIHPDIHFIFPVIKQAKDDGGRESCADWYPEWKQFLETQVYSNYNDWIEAMGAKNQQGNITAAECLDIVRTVSLKAFESPYKIFVLWLPEFLEKEGNRLLKVIEEPPDQTVFLFVAHDQDRIINTILSRLQILNFPRLAEQDIATGLVKKNGIDILQAKKIARLSEGNFHEACRIAAMEENENTGLLQSWLEACLRQNLKELFKWNDTFVKMGREYQKDFFLYCIHFFRQVLLQELGLSQLNNFSEQEMKMAEGLGSAMGRQRITSIIELLDKSIYFVERNANGKILINYVSIRMMKAMQQQGVNEKPPFYEKWAY